MPHIVYRGDDWKFDFQYTENGDAKDITGNQEIKACLKSDTVTPVTVTRTGNEITVINAPAGKGTIKIPKTKTDLVKKGVQNLLVELTDSNGDETTIILDKFLDIRSKDC